MSYIVDFFTIIEIYKKKISHFLGIFFSLCVITIIVATYSHGVPHTRLGALTTIKGGRLLLKSPICAF